MLQRILTLKYLGFSLRKIEEIMASRSIEQQLSEQKELLIRKKRHLEEIISAIEVMENSQESDKYGFLIRLLNLLTEDEKIQEQYRTSGNLEKRIRLHDYSTSSQGWMEWVYERLALREGGQGPGTGMRHRTAVAGERPQAAVRTASDADRPLFWNAGENPGKPLGMSGDI